MEKMLAPGVLVGFAMLGLHQVCSDEGPPPRQ